MSSEDMVKLTECGCEIDGKASKFGEFYGRAGITDVRDNGAQSTTTNQNIL
jgi:hypothetical protein